MASSSRRTSTAEVVILRQRVKELEEQVSSCKKRLDNLRKAKNTTILKREREILEVNAPKLGVRRDSDSRLADLQRQVEQSERQKQKELDALRKKLEAEMDDLRNKFQAENDVLRSSLQTENNDLCKKLQAEIDDLKSQKAKSRISDDSSQLSQLLQQLEEVRGDNMALVIENRGLQDQAHQLVMELSEKEAGWCEREEQLNKKLNEQWGERYAEWMAKVEHKMEELKQANTMLQTMLRQKKPPGPDHSGQDSSGSN